ncbi:methyltransferase domain-containing protein [Sporolactobacillus sp. THM7-4]|nr:methyltransferase domain-containing protein [Sporolactobacillus sp. THM7-4]
MEEPFNGWASTQQNELNLLNRKDFEQRFAENSIDAMLAEHVWEHMAMEDGIIAAQNCYDFLKPGGYLRCAVPDAYFRNEEYQRYVINEVGSPDILINNAAYSTNNDFSN